MAVSGRPRRLVGDLRLRAVRAGAIKIPEWSGEGIAGNRDVARTGDAHDTVMRSIRSG